MTLMYNISQRDCWRMSKALFVFLSAEERRMIDPALHTKLRAFPIYQPYANNETDVSFLSVNKMRTWSLLPV